MQGRDVYGYTARDYLNNSEQYRRYGEEPDVGYNLTREDYEFLNDVNQFY
jgi:hypothetical protein